MNSGIEASDGATVLESGADLPPQIKSNDRVLKCSAANREHLAGVIFVPFVGCFFKLKVLFRADPRFARGAIFLLQ